jgi:hypothetical protein
MGSDCFCGMECQKPCIAIKQIQAERDMLVKDIKTGKLYNPQIEFDKLMEDPETVKIMKRLKECDNDVVETIITRLEKAVDESFKASLTDLAKKEIK